MKEQQQMNARMNDDEMEMDGPADRSYNMPGQGRTNSDYDRYLQNQEQSFQTRDRKDSFLPLNRDKKSSNSRGSRESFTNSGGHSGSKRRDASNSNGSGGSRGLNSNGPATGMISGFSNYGGMPHK